MDQAPGNSRFLLDHSVYGSRMQSPTSTAGVAKRRRERIEARRYSTTAAIKAACLPVAAVCVVHADRATVNTPTICHAGASAQGIRMVAPRIRLNPTSRNFLFALVFLTAAPAWAVNKCSEGGRVVYQDAPCEGGKGQALTIRPATGAGSAVATGAAQARLDKLKADNAMSEAIRTHKPLVGMTSTQLQEAMGTPTKVNADNYNGTQRDQVIFERRTETWFVYLRNGMVESIQHRPGAPTGSMPAQEAGRCPSQHEIKGAITSASSIALGERERAERWKAIRAMQECGK